MRVRIGTFNAENLFARLRFKDDYSLAGGSQDQWTVGATQMLPFSDRYRMTAQAMGAIQADVLALQEIENLMTLKQFLRQFKAYWPEGGYPYQILIEGNDRRLIDVALISRYPLGYVRTYQHDRNAKGQLIFSRDCLEVDVLLPNDKRLTVFVNHFKSMHGGREETMHIRKIQASRVVDIVQSRFHPDPGSASWVIAGDFNDFMPSEGLAPLLTQPWLENVLERLPKSNQWTHYFAGADEYNQLDYLLISKALADANPNAMPIVERRGLPKRALKATGDRFPGVGFNTPKASDHCPVVIELELL
ncbi:endonuclease/exonuclease/phosphatase family protein [Leptolyngbya sp. AN02str]|uniref:endonuclease/exonuclease/phosphatase family protein n=1 Tax=Leptolyngbya sp. AN02str TaxID=3423363 RepID=UPI003D323A00